MTAKEISNFPEIYEIIMDNIGHTYDETEITFLEELLLHIARQNGKLTELDDLMYNELNEY
jgi:hypothetical protein